MIDGAMRLSLLFFGACVVGMSLLPMASSVEEQEGADVNMSSKCAAVLLTLGATAGAGVAYATVPSTLCTLGFRQVGVAKGSFAAWWQSTLPLVHTGSLFAQLQSLAMAGSGASTVLGGSMFGSAIAAQYVNNFCGTSTMLILHLRLEWR